MKKILLASAVLTTLATASVAADFDESAVNLQFNRDNIQAEMRVIGGDLRVLQLGAYVLPHALGTATADVFVSAGYDVVTQRALVELEYAATQQLNDQWSIYGNAYAVYSVDTGEDTTGTWVLAPKLGATYQITDQFSTFAEVSYGWDVSNDFGQQGGYVKLGGTYDVGTDGIFIEPVIFRTFDTASDATNVGLTLGMAF